MRQTILNVKPEVVRRVLDTGYCQYKEPWISDRTKKGKIKKWLQKKLMAFMKKHKLLEVCHQYEEITTYTRIELNNRDLWREIYNMMRDYEHRGIEISMIVIGRTTYGKYMQGDISNPLYVPYLSQDEDRRILNGAEVLLHPDIEGVVFIPKRRW